MQTKRGDYKIIPLVKKFTLYRDVPETTRHAVYEKLDFLWRETKFVPSPVKSLARDFPGVTETVALHLILAWQQTRVGQALNSGAPLDE
jgi:hypothetical protein